MTGLLAIRTLACLSVAANMPQCISSAYPYRHCVEVIIIGWPVTAAENEGNWEPQTIYRQQNIIVVCTNLQAYDKPVWPKWSTDTLHFLDWAKDFSTGTQGDMACVHSAQWAQIEHVQRKCLTGATDGDDMAVDSTMLARHVFCHPLARFPCEWMPAKYWFLVT